MADSLRTDARAIDDASHADPDAKIEQLLVAGLDHYFAQRYEEAINIWTRTLFFDRSHARARAYIERARSALAERQRRSEELLHRGVAALERGEDIEARRLLESAVEHGAHAADVHPLLDRLTRSDPSDATSTAAGLPLSPIVPASAADVAAAEPRAGGVTRAGLWVAAAMLMVVVAAAVVVALRNGLDPRAAWIAYDPPAGTAPPPPVAAIELPRPRRGEMALGRARALAARGQLHEALTSLESVRPTDPEKTEADRVKAEIQRQLLGMSGRRP